jgi:hypothetical protein
MIFGGGFIGFLAVIVVIRLLAQIRDQGAPVAYANTPSESGRAFVVLMLIALGLCVYNYHGAWTVPQ